MVRCCWYWISRTECRSQNLAIAPGGAVLHAGQFSWRANKSPAARFRVKVSLRLKLSALFGRFHRLCNGRCREPKRKASVRIHVSMLALHEEE